MQIIPALDLLGNDAVRLEKGDYEKVIFRQPIDDFLTRIIETSPSLIHIVDLQGARDGAIRSEIIEQCVTVAGSVPLQVSGGIRSVAAAKQALSAGASRVIVGTAAWENPESLKMFADSLGDELVVAFDVRNNQLAVKGWLATTGLDVEDALVKCEEAGVRRLHVTAIERDGTMSGPDIDLYRRVCQSSLAIVAAGGVRDDDDIAALEAVGCEAVVMGMGYLPRLGLNIY